MEPENTLFLNLTSFTLCFQGRFLLYRLTICSMPSLLTHTMYNTTLRPVVTFKLRELMHFID
jgi:hypothetical protein